MANNNNMLQICRLCLVKDDVNIPIFEDQGDIRQIFLKISSCLPVKVAREDRLPKKICDGCSYKLDMLYEFWNTSANAEKQLLSWLGEAGVPSKMADGALTAVAQQMKPAEAFVKEETLELPDGHADDDDKEYLFAQQKVEESASAGPSATVTSNEDEEPPPKRARRTAAVKAAIAMDQESDDDDDSGEPLTKIEDESEDSDGEDHVPAFVDVPSTSADDQPGPSGVGKDGVEAPSVTPGSKKELKVVFTDLKHDKTLEFDGKTYVRVEERKKQHTCYICMLKFSTLSELNVHKHLHDESEAEDDLFEEDYPSSANKNTSIDETSAIEDKVKNLDVLLKTQEKKPASPIPTSKPKPSEVKKLDTSIATKSPFRCDTCDVCFETSDEAKTHLPKASKTKCKFACRLCTRKFNTLYAFVVHVMQHKNDVSKIASRSVYTCGSCGKHFDDCFQLKRHEITTHKKTPSKSQLPLPKNVPVVVPEVKKVQVEVEDEAEPELTCELCYDVFKTKQELDSHTEFHKQLENCSEPVILDDDESSTEIIVEDHHHNRVTTIHKATTSNTFVKMNTKDYVCDKFSLASPTVQQSKQKITAKIKDIISKQPSDTKSKQSKTILLPAARPKGKAKVPTSRPLNHNKPIPEKPPLEVQKTGPTTFSVVYKDGTSSSSMQVSQPHTSVTTNSISAGQSLLKNVSSNNFTYVFNPSVSAVTNYPTTSSAFTTGTANSSIMLPDYLNNSNLMPNAASVIPSFGSPSHMMLNSMSSNNLTYFIDPSSNATTTLASAPQVSSTGSGTPMISSVAADSSNQTNDGTQYAYVIIPNSPTTAMNSGGPVLTPAMQEALINALSKNSLQNNPTVSNELVQNADPPALTPKPTNIKPSFSSVTASAAATEVDSSSIFAAPSTSKSVPEEEPAPSVPEEMVSILIEDSDSSCDAPVAEGPGLDSFEDEGNLVIDENVVTSPEVKPSIPADWVPGASGSGEGSGTPCEEKKGFITVKKLKDLIGTDHEEAAEKKAKKKFPIQCDGCKSVIYKYRSWRNHEKKKISCKSCDFKCCRSKVMKLHFGEKHGRKFCTKCNYFTDSDEDYDNHQQQQHKCPHCSGIFLVMSLHECKNRISLPDSNDIIEVPTSSV